MLPLKVFFILVKFDNVIDVFIQKLKKKCYHVNIIYFCNKETRQNIFSMFITYSKVLEVLYFLNKNTIF